MREGEEETHDPEEDDSPPNDDAPSAMLTFEVIWGREVVTAQEVIVVDAPPSKPPKSYNLRSKGPMLDAALEDKKRDLLRRILPPTNTS